MGVNHGYSIDTNAIWLEKIEKIKNSLHVWKTRNLTFKGKTLIIKNLIIPIIGYEIEMRGIPDIYAKQINDIVWSFIWDNKLNKIDRIVCCLSKNEGGMNMINLFNFIKSKQIKTIYKIMHSKLETWNAIGKYWLQSKDMHSSQEYFLCTCSDLSPISLNNMSSFYNQSTESTESR